MKFIQYKTTKKDKFLKNEINNTTDERPTLHVSQIENRIIEGFGSCFNELGMKALNHLDKDERNKVFDQLFSIKGDCRFNLCRMPIGASDYATEWYSYNENENDFDMEKFSIQKDKRLLIPYIKEALKRNPNIILTASPWSPPTWMKTQKAYNFGTLRFEEKVLKAYALYFVKFVQAYEEEGITIHQVHVQNEVVADQKFPSCRWTGDQLRDFIKNYLGPAFEKHNIKSEIWLGTINGPEPYVEWLEDYTQDFDVYAGLVLRDPKAYKYVKGVGYQWAGKNAIQRSVEAFPEKRFIQTENECGNGKNTWIYAEYVFNLFRHYIVNGVNGYMYWNAVLEPKGMSTWGWEQNSMITVNPETKEVMYNPEFYVMKHFSHFVQKGAKRLTTSGVDSVDTVAFKNPDESIIIVISNKNDDSRIANIEFTGEIFEVELEGHSFNTIVLE
ncbi:glycosyl hydrolase [Clostridium botulinum]|uniref:glycoside hydrolase family 30 protein n=1 Tax=Clostridium botulinum TaxID=1491 RepID=UPI0009472E0B|nr:glycoside hydrolase family 30 protein [Clostridium botulinum]APQ77634.1 O-Glycosyl hydrolase 30 family protein [Clostridium botulinum]AUM98666.1 glycosyl hydrolase [Clostridium botulinum]MBN3353038.1 glycosyl hydrolase [Clostridium botulinum]MBN3408587.1 glycosyl hydrolase [Clostridium botulinum]MBY6796380.1 glycoside hydrolase family 30 protein [Clostridium botulinum]